MKTLALLAVSICLVACAGAPNDEPPDCVAGYPSLSMSQLANRWYDDGTVKPPRTYSFELAGSFTVSDSVAPCPAGETCVWSGIVDNSGRVTLDEAAEQLTLVYDTPMQTSAGLSFPTTLSWGGDCGRARLREAETQRSFQVPTR